MKYNHALAVQIGSILTPQVRVRTEAIAKIHRDSRGADLAYVDVELMLGGTPIATHTFIAKTSARNNTGRWIAIPETLGSDGEYHPNFRVSNELRAACASAVFAHPRVRLLAERAERQLAGGSTSEQKQSDPRDAKIAELSALVEQLMGELRDEREDDLDEDVEAGCEIESTPFD